MGVKLAVLYYPSDSAGDAPDPAEAVATLFPRSRYEADGEGDLVQYGFPAQGELCAGRLRDGLLVTTRDAALFNPTKLHKRYRSPALGGGPILLTQRSQYDMFAYARWESGTLIRSLSVNPGSGVWESIGAPEPFEEPFWAGKRPAGPGYPLPFHPLDLGEAALNALLGVVLEGPPGPGLLDADQIGLTRFVKVPSARGQAVPT
ncbi:MULTISPECIES: DUF6928 family protein [unclassified Gordonia (in: high G+C Gram-positive bacteria)]|uniref:DUF6928 family protein n=1 Tax=unclassified Gordonia (in: high G+C Gram-positive bacteria) TaxID=2657482 RepID=UPI001FFF911B|nr:MULTISPECIES: hypothetical protein [unclassified Gordonia (in: high G+C Gram-positive bacteria)]UQE74095.1 hypothetical protein MYK68_15350 [Gordonia sp. PP30]